MILELDHIGIVLHDLQESVVSFGTMTGTSMTQPQHVESQQVQAALLPVGPRTGDVKLELISAIGENSTVARFLSRFGPGLHHLAFRVDNLEEAIAGLRAAGFEIVGEAQRGHDNCEFVFIHPRSSGGVLLEVLQRQR